MSYRGVASLVAVVSLIVPLRPTPRANGRAGETRPKTITDEPAHLGELRSEGFRLLREGNYLQAAALCRKGLEAAKAERAPRSTLRFLLNLGNANYHMHRYRDALPAYVEARRLAEKQRDWEILEAVSINLSSLYLHLGAFDAAKEAARSALQNPGAAGSPNRAKLLLHAAHLRAAGNETREAEKLFREAILAARKLRDDTAEAQALTGLGDALIARGRAAEAIEHLRRAVELRQQAGNDAVFFSYEALGRAYGQTGNHDAAIALFTSAIASARRASVPVALWSSHYERGRANLALGRNADGYHDLEEALHWARRWKAEVLPADTFRLSTSVELHQIYSVFLEAASRLYEQTGRQRFAEAAFAAAEEIRAQSLRALLTRGDGWRRSLPDSYWQTLAKLQKTEIKSMQDGSTRTAEAASALRVALAEMEARAGLDTPEAGDAWRGEGIILQVRRSLSAAEAYLGFSLGDHRSYLYAVSREGFEVHDLPPKRELVPAIAAFTAMVANGSPASAEQGAALYSQIFAKLGPPFRSKSLWILGLDGILFELPFAALVEGRQENRPVYLVERHAIQAVPSVFALLAGSSVADADGPFVGFGDPIYNRADPRWPRKRQRFERFAGLAAGMLRAADDSARQLSRLPGSGRELQVCARRWVGKSAPILLTGAKASKANLEAALATHPSVLHIAAHFVVPEHDGGSAMIALGLTESGELDYLSATEIANLRARLGLVIMNGCASGAAAVLPGEGLMGLTRAWLAAGASAVIAARWPVADSSGELFEALYSSLNARRERGSFARALQQAQISSLLSGGRRANPSYWSAYFCFERN